MAKSRLNPNDHQNFLSPGQQRGTTSDEKSKAELADDERAEAILALYDIAPPRKNLLPYEYEFGKPIFEEKGISVELIGRRGDMATIVNILDITRRRASITRGRIGLTVSEAEFEWYKGNSSRGEIDNARAWERKRMIGSVRDSFRELKSEEYEKGREREYETWLKAQECIAMEFLSHFHLTTLTRDDLLEIPEDESFRRSDAIPVKAILAYLRKNQTPPLPTTKDAFGKVVRLTKPPNFAIHMTEMGSAGSRRFNDRPNKIQCAITNDGYLLIVYFHETSGGNYGGSRRREIVIRYGK